MDGLTKLMYDTFSKEWYDSWHSRYIQGYAERHKELFTLRTEVTRWAMASLYHGPHLTPKGRTFQSGLTRLIDYDILTKWFARDFDVMWPPK